MKKLWIILLAITSGYGIASAQKPAVVVSDKTGWHKIGSTTVDFQKEQDEISVIGADKFAALKLKVSDASVEINDVTIFYEDKTTQRAEIRRPMMAGDESRVIKVDGGEKDIEKISFIYKTVANSRNEKATVELWGMKTNTDEMGDKNRNNNDKDRSGYNNSNDRVRTDNNNNSKSTAVRANNGNMPPVSEWEKLGSAKVDFKKDRDEVHVRNDKYFSAIKFRVTEASINLTSMEVYYENGISKQTIPVNEVIRSSGESKVIDLKGSSRDIDKIVFVYKTLDNKMDDKAHVEVWGLRDHKEMGATTDEKNN